MGGLRTYPKSSPLGGGGARSATEGYNLFPIAIHWPEYPSTAYGGPPPLAGEDLC